ncbi:tRNA (guanosine(46)-N7)-methyltransferase TrmB [Phenylobacterium sp.]|uniref:tRNA (guanosine(46)-N7)-methyltransferase TrmB n=1 Tax=Phenylobacterium sp. TaxID=1871053 RepID=UPI0027335D4B|nr:tRNA (guanosine(46)-N7)-methyltransferase TrmB [Phenylobacterium sp.]MDP3854677.1 tRNA (guanosine(46)-N7)-methyltransferase TrmB [Phenylobacterium sp.]
MEETAHPLMRSYGRIKSRPIKPRQAALVESLLPQIRAPQAPFDPRDLMPEAREVWLEIGFGGGEHMAAQAGRAPDVLIIGCEPFLNGVASAVRHVSEQGLKNVRIQDGDARELVAHLPDACLARVFILFPDPWPKARHHKRRIVQPEMLEDLARVMKPGARLRFATDVAGYADWALERVLASPHFDWTAQAADDWRTPPADHVTTRYEEKRLGDCAPVFFDFVRA